MDFVKICNLSKILNNKDCDLTTKLFYRENLAHALQIWDAYEWPRPILDASFRHFDKYKVFKISHYVMQYSFVFTSIINPSYCFVCYIEI
jgi:hypothetical protein